MFALQQHRHRWLWLALALWVTTLQAVAEVHASEHSLLHVHHHCLLCNFSEASGHAPISSLPTVAVVPVKVIPVAAPLYLTPSLPIL